MTQRWPGYRLWLAGLALAAALTAIVGAARAVAGDYSPDWCREDEACFASVVYHDAAEACFHAVDGAMPHRGQWRLSRYAPPKKAFIGYKVVSLRKGIIRLVGDRITVAEQGKGGRGTTYLYSCDWHAIDRRIAAMAIYSERQAPVALRSRVFMRSSMASRAISAFCTNTRTSVPSRRIRETSDPPKPLPIWLASVSAVKPRLRASGLRRSRSSACPP